MFFLGTQEGTATVVFQPIVYLPGNRFKLQMERAQQVWGGGGIEAAVKKDYVGGR